MELIIALGLGGWAILIVGSLIFGGAAQIIGETRTGYEWLVDAVAAGSGASHRERVHHRLAGDGSRRRRALSCPPSQVAWWSVSSWSSPRDTSREATTPTGRCPPDASRVGCEADMGPADDRSAGPVIPGNRGAMALSAVTLCCGRRNRSNSC